MEILVGARVDGQRWALKEGLGNESCAVVWKRDISPRRYLLQHIALLGMSRKTWYSANAPISPSLGDTYKLRKGWNTGCARHWFPQSCCQDKNSILLSMLLWWKRPRIWCLYLKSHLLHSRSDRWMMSSLRSNWGTHAPIRLDLVSGFLANRTRVPHCPSVWWFHSMFAPRLLIYWNLDCFEFVLGSLSTMRPFKWSWTREGTYYYTYDFTGSGASVTLIRMVPECDGTGELGFLFH